MKHSPAALAVLLGLCAHDAGARGWQPAAGHRQVPIWPGPIPDAVPAPGPESATTLEHRVAGKPWTWVANVTDPTITLYSPDSENTGVAVIVFPGGGYKGLAIDLEGTEVCDWLASKGMTGVLLKYRVPDSGPHYERSCDCEVDPKAPMALEDAQRAISVVRFHAAEWGVNPSKVGVIGFSAGGHIVAETSTLWGKRAYPAVDGADRQSCRPDFAIAVYPGHMLENTTREFELNPTIPVTREAPPTLIVQAVDDPVDPVENSLVYFIALKKAGVPVEMHLYEGGGHAFGLRPTRDPITRWPQLVETWLGTIRMTQR